MGCEIPNIPVTPRNPLCEKIKPLLPTLIPSSGRIKHPSGVADIGAPMGVGVGVEIFPVFTLHQDDRQLKVAKFGVGVGVSVSTAGRVIIGNSVTAREELTSDDWVVAVGTTVRVSAADDSDSGRVIRGRILMIATRTVTMPVMIAPTMTGFCNRFF